MTNYKDPQSPSPEHFAELYREAEARGRRDYERGSPRASNPFKDDAATEQATRWYDGWDSAYELDRAD